MKAIIADHTYRRMGALLLLFTIFGLSLSLANPALRYQRVSGRIERREERTSGRIERRDERISNRIERRDMLFSPPTGATAVSVNGVRCYQTGGDTYQPAFYEGQTVYVKVDVD